MSELKCNDCGKELKPGDRVRVKSGVWVCNDCLDDYLDNSRDSGSTATGREK